MALGEQRYHDISPVTLQVGGQVSSSLYCGEAGGPWGGQVEAFLVELFRCKLCEFTCSRRGPISTHLLSHRGGGSPYQDLSGGAKQDEDDFLLYNMLISPAPPGSPPPGSPPPGDISGEVAHTCEREGAEPIREEEEVEERGKGDELLLLSLPQELLLPSDSQETPGLSRRRETFQLIQKKSLDLHARRHHSGEAFPCRQCSYSSPDQQLLQRHTRRHHGNTEDPTL
ncbi:Zinc finger protein 516 [Dissostichus eleginoides]|uniref:Zinc finger protein 516 n=1 Tax=Dissostichus eleginoides TaxID=100907 RepID=A0AAD9B3D4_DISEL|nr:Zinc finger protein 516 [Dissostichus eleginoides]